MASAFTHAFAAVAVGKTWGRTRKSWRFLQWGSSVLGGLRGLAHTFQKLFGQVLIFGANRKVTDRGNANEPFVPVDHSDAPNLFLLHQPRNFFQALVFEAPADPRRHHVANFGLQWIIAVCNGAHRQIAIGDGPDQS